VKEIVMIPNETLVRFAGLMHVGVGVAGLSMPFVLNLRHELTKVPPFVRHLMWTYYGFIAATIAAFGAASLLAAQHLTDGSTLARLLCGFMAAFRSARLTVGLFAFDAGPYLTTPVRRVGYVVLTASFAVLAAIYALAAVG
jgi:hypothetical protein